MLDACSNSESLIDRIRDRFEMELIGPCYGYIKVVCPVLKRREKMLQILLYTYRGITTKFSLSWQAGLRRQSRNYTPFP